LNNSKVIPARLLGTKKRTGGQVEIFLLNKSENDCYETLLRPLKRIKDGDEIVFKKSNLKAYIVDRERRLVRFSKKNILPDLEKIGHMPLPPYIKRADKFEDKKYYQTVFAKKEGSVASPTAGLHFTNQLLAKLKTQGHKTEQITLHINYATFKPVEERDVTKHKMHFEEYAVTQRTLNNIKKAKSGKKAIVAVGTTSCRVLETLGNRGKLSGRTDIFMYPGYKFKMADALITNFHLPFSTLLMLVYAFGGTDLMKKAYKEAVKEKYRFYSYGDGMLIK
jgi:S-adenosylmethionine:tRNA ribosyltransferase-isomerase